MFLIIFYENFFTSISLTLWHLTIFVLMNLTIQGNAQNLYESEYNIK